LVNPSVLLLALIGLSGVMITKFISNKCDIADIQGESDSSRSLPCKDHFYKQISLRANGAGKANCTRITKGDLEAIDEGLKLNKEVINPDFHFNESSYINMTTDCSYFKKNRKYMPFPMSKEEENFPIAYSMVIHEKIDMFERLLRAIYAPQNIYCVHVDEKSPAVFKEAVNAITSCFDNVFIASKLVKVVYAAWPRVQADLNCMEDLLQSKVLWKYLLNTCGTDFPLKTNAEIVRTLKSLNGKNSMESEKPSSSKKTRWEFHFEVGDSISKTAIEKSPPPIDSPMFTGNAYIVVCRNFVEHIFNNPQALTLIEWVKDTYSPDEHLWATLNRMPGVPGSSPYSDKYEKSDMNAVARMVKWGYMEGDIAKGAPYPPCTGTHRRSICVYGTGDLYWLLEQHHVLANKFDPKVDNIALECLEEYLRHKTVYGKGL
uniref:Beta-1,3-galactosyl-O-glycosyl-glycoprotein beta-1,6-N-acetylglucosaminyltransferase 3 n=1 Tax=Xenopus tropicalis TaxID=8364 RepID=A0A6I8PZN3_XENTR